LGNLLIYYRDAEGPGDCGSGVFMAEEADGVDVEILLVTFKQDCHISGLLLSCRSIRIFGGSAFTLKEFYSKWRL
jgi:hypothetical protein